MRRRAGEPVALTLRRGRKVPPKLLPPTLSNTPPPPASAPAEPLRTAASTAVAAGAAPGSGRPGRWTRTRGRSKRAPPRAAPPAGPRRRSSSGGPCTSRGRRGTWRTCWRPAGAGRRGRRRRGVRHAGGRRRAAHVGELPPESAGRNCWPPGRVIAGGGGPVGGIALAGDRPDTHQCRGTAQGLGGGAASEQALASHLGAGGGTELRPGLAGQGGEEALGCLLARHGGGMRVWSAGGLESCRSPGIYRK